MKLGEIFQVYRFFTLESLSEKIFRQPLIIYSRLKDDFTKKGSECIILSRSSHLKNIIKF